MVQNKLILKIVMIVEFYMVEIQIQNWTKLIQKIQKLLNYLRLGQAKFFISGWQNSTAVKNDTVD